MSSKTSTFPPLALSQVLSDLSNARLETIAPISDQELASLPRVTASDANVDRSMALTAAFIEHSRRLLGRTDEFESLGRALQGIHERAADLSTSVSTANVQTSAQNPL
jgi:hypothetical protein